MALLRAFVKRVLVQEHVRAGTLVPAHWRKWPRRGFFRHPDQLEFVFC
jgi:hypothetical protein